ncbi:uncharacterized protein C8A04DRAFT_24265 [Dichotomopilus funicola]|uniref:Uncharacterized protein n=1 Tax=Dichotomopilus funicola TaxID=1934379 RepID=A0AAN6VAH5_9PEZI|nr:hypothetical protein C8A04DRAFT_24265 [Dichotomopilus funicola]
MCLIGLLIPAKPKKSKSRSSRKHRSRSRSPHRRRYERPRHEHSSRHRHDNSRHESSRRERSSTRQEKRHPPQDSSRDSAAVVEDALARLCLSLEQSLIEEQQRWRAQDRWERRAELSRLDHASGGRIPADEVVGQQAQGQKQEEAPPYSPTDNTKTARVPHPILTTITPDPQPEPEQYQRGVADSPACRVENSTSVSCCHNCVCARCGSNVTMCDPEVPELEHDSPARGAFSARHRAGLGE